MINLSFGRRLIGVALLAGWLSGCGVDKEEFLASFVTEPGKFKLYNCQQISQKATEVAARQKELLALAVKAETGLDGRLVSEVTYRPEYSTLRGEMNELRREGTAKNCQSLPGESPKRNSDSAIR
jgi:hypothetical protein